LPGGFSDTKVTDPHLPTAPDFTPDGRMLVTSKTGELYVYDGSGNRLANPAARPSCLCQLRTRSARVAVDPDFASRRNYRYPSVA
jgi:glucose/arabinose dehydrogenase